MCAINTLTERALELAYYLYEDKETAKLVAKRALDALSLEIAKRNHRLDYFVPIRRRSKPVLTDKQTLQKLIYDKSAEIEARLLRNVPHDFSEERLRIIYIKFLVWQSLQYNAAFTLTAMCRLLFKYQMSTVQEIYSTATYAQLNVDDAGIRIRKKILMDDLKNHFGDLLVEMRGSRNERHFKPDPLAQSYWPTVRETLNVLLPWDTGPCLSKLPELSNDEIKKLQSDNIYQSHVLICPQCLSNIMAYLGQNSLDQSLSLPLFQFQ